MAERVEKLTIEVGGRNKAGGVFAEVERSVDRLKQRFGPRSFMKDLTEIAVGGGALAGISFVGRTFAELTKGVTGFADKLAEGKQSTVELVAELAKGLPIIGGFAQGFESILSSLTGIGGEMKQLQLGAQSQDRFSGMMGGIAAATQKGLAASQNRIRDLGIEGYSRTLGDGPNAAVAKLNLEHAKRFSSLNSTFSDTVKIIEDSASLERKELLKEINELKRQFSPDGQAVQMTPDKIALKDRIDASEGRLNSIGRTTAREIAVLEAQKKRELAANAEDYRAMLSRVDTVIPFNRMVEPPAGKSGFDFPAGPGGIPFISEDRKSAIERESAVKYSALAMAQEELARMQAARAGGGSVFASADTRRGIMGVRSLGSVNDGPSEREKALIQAIKDLKKELEKPDPLLEEAVQVLKSYRVFLDPKSEL